MLRALSSRSAGMDRNRDSENFHVNRRKVVEGGGSVSFKEDGINPRSSEIDSLASGRGRGVYAEGFHDYLPNLSCGRIRPAEVTEVFH
ncbi:hypothetical protein SLA2020_378710 [Shorea laevis]